MENKPITGDMEIDLLKLFKALLHRAWLIVLSGIVCGAIAFSYAYFVIVPQYKSTVMFYVNNTSGNSQTITSGELTAAKNLLQTYVVILKTPQTLEMVIKESNLAYSESQLKKMISAASVDSTEIFSISVTAPNPEEAKLIADTITKILPDRIKQVVTESTVSVVSEARVPTAKSEPNITKYTALGMAAGILACCAIIVVLELLNNTVRDEEYLTSTYNYPILAAIPDLNAKGSGKYGYYKQKSGKKNDQHYE